MYASGLTDLCTCALPKSHTMRGNSEVRAIVDLVNKYIDVIGQGLRGIVTVPGLSRSENPGESLKVALSAELILLVAGQALRVDDV